MPKFRPFTLVHHPQFVDHDSGGGEHPEIPSRIVKIYERLQNSLLTPIMTVAEPQPAPRELVEAFHDSSYLYRFEEAALAGQTAVDHPDNQICYDSYDVAMLAAGAGISGIDLLEKNAADRVFCNVRPPGHHAEKSSALGFCFFNNAVIAAMYWQQKYGRRVLIVDWDAHHGNGIQSAFEHEADVFYMSIHEHPTFSFPGTGYAEDRGIDGGEGTTLNLPLPPGADDKMFLQVLTEKAAPAIEKFKPDAIIVAAGFDGHQLDDMSGLHYSTTLYGQIGVYMNRWARQFCGGKLLSILEGGYHIEALAASVEAYIAGICVNE